MVSEGKVAGVALDATATTASAPPATRHPWTLGLERFPYYDVHSAFWMKLLPAEWGWDVMDVEYEPRDAAEPVVARYVIFKQPRSE